LVANLSMTSCCDVTNSVYPVTMTTKRHCSMLEFSRWGGIQSSSRPGHHKTSARHCSPMVISTNYFDITAHPETKWTSQQNVLIFCCFFISLLFSSICRHISTEPLPESLQYHLEYVWWKKVMRPKIKISLVKWSNANNVCVSKAFLT